MNKLGNEIIKSGLAKEYDFIDMSYKRARFSELKKGVLKKQIVGGISPCIKTNITNYGVVVSENYGV